MSSVQIQGWELEQAHNTMSKLLWPWMKDQIKSGNRVTVEGRLTEDMKTDEQRKFYHGVILTQIAQQAKPNGGLFPMPVWKEFFRKKYLGYKTRTDIDPMTGKKVKMRVRQSTEGLSLAGYARLIKKVTAFAVTELGVEFTELNPTGIDPDSGEIYEH